jgi:hypothetical protein
MQGIQRPQMVLSMMVAFDLLLCLPPIVLGRRLLSVRRTGVLTAVEVTLLVAPAGFVVFNPSILARSASTTAQNLFFVANSRGIGSVLLISLSLVLSSAVSDRVTVHARYVLTTAVPLVFLLVYLRDGDYRVHEADSLNRMVMQFLPLLAFCVGARASFLMKLAEDRGLVRSQRSEAT